MKVQTEILKEMVSKAEKASSNNKSIPITQLMCIRVVDNELTLITTDATNYLYVSREIDEDDFYVVVHVEQFSKLVSKLSSDTVELTLTDRSLEVKANGTYSIELPLDENGSPVVYLDPLAKFNDIDYDKSISKEAIDTILEYVKPSIETNDTSSETINYFSGKTVIATNQYKIAQYLDGEVLPDEYLISAELMDLLGLICEDSVQYMIDDDVIVAHSNDSTVYGILESIDEYPIDIVEKLLDEKFDSYCKLSRQELLNALERIALFIGKYDNKTIRLTFNKNGVNISNKSDKSVELVEYLESKKHKDFECLIDVELLMSQLKAYSSDNIELHYGKEHSIKLVAKDGVRQIIALNIQ